MSHYSRQSLIRLFRDNLATIRIIVITVSFALCILLSQLLPFVNEDATTSFESRAPSHLVAVTLLMAILWFTSVMNLAIVASIPLFLFPLMGIMSAE